ncbi:MAG: hypothetical protein EBS01_02405, partial [Verrucomicrobia bacterium]|nr:hypothetical protein [Verrucomicrobiota bacterium]
MAPAPFGEANCNGRQKRVMETQNTQNTQAFDGLEPAALLGENVLGEGDGHKTRRDLGGVGQSVPDNAGAQRFQSGSARGQGAPDAAPGSGSTVMVRIRPKAHWTRVDFAELWEYRDLLWSFAIRDLKLRYRQTSLGVLWVVFQPVAGAGVFALVFGWVAGMASEKQSYFVFSLPGVLVWTAFQSTLSKCSMALLGSSALVSKVYFPRLLLPLSTLLSTLVDFAIGLAVFVLAGLCTGWRPDWTALLALPVW